MADATGALHYEFGGKAYTLRLTFGGIAQLQARHGNDLAGLLTGNTGPIPPFAVMIDMVAVALQKGMKMPAEEAGDLADDMLTDDKGMFERLMRAAFPDAVGNVEAPKKAKG